MLATSRLPPCFWSYAAPTFCTLYNASNPGGDAETPWERATGKPFPAARIPFGTKVVFKPSPSRHQDLTEKWDPKARQGVFAGYSMTSSWEWDGYYKVWDLTELHKL